MMARENKSQFALLGVLSLGPQSGYEIKKLIEESLAHFWQEGYGQIYPNLKKLVDSGFATVQTERQDGKPDKKIYTITAEGESTLKGWLKTPIQALPKEKHEILLKLFFGRNVSVNDNLEHVKLHQGRMRELLSIYKRVEESLQKNRSEEPDTVYHLITVRSGILTAEASLEWCKETIETLNNVKGADVSESNIEL